jgi:hypothetical protein
MEQIDLLSMSFAEKLCRCVPAWFTALSSLGYPTRIKLAKWMLVSHATDTFNTVCPY